MIPELSVPSQRGEHLYGSRAEAVARIERLIGKSYVLSTPEAIAARSRDTSAWLTIAAAVICPATSEEVAGVMKICTELGVPVWPFSKGKNWGYGATMGLYDGAFILMLDRLDRIIEVSEELAYAVIEPGVTQGQLNAYLKEHKLRLWSDCTDSTPDGSVIGNSLERGVGYTPYCDHFANLCGLEVVLPNGEVVRTGGGPSNSRTWHTHKWGTGPSLDGLFGQSNLGIVTRAGVWLMPEPEDFGCFLCEIEDPADLPAVIDVVRRLALDRVIPGNVHLGNDVLLLAQMTQYPYDRLTTGQTFLSPAARAQLRKRFRTAPWTLSCGLYGSKAHVRASRAIIARELKRFGRLTYVNDRTFRVLTGAMELWAKPLGKLLSPLLERLSHATLPKLEVIRHIYPILKGIPGEYIVGFAYFKSATRPREDVDPARDRAGLMWQAVACPLRGTDTDALVKLCERIFHEHGFDFSIALIAVNPRTVLGLMEIFYRKDDAEESARAVKLQGALAEATLAAGYPQYRTTVAFSERVLAGAPAYQALVDALKNALDPGHVLAPGRYGIALRDAELVEPSSE
ncbi:MAG: hypothetical protein JWN04_4383 [Myxococcaceae bacterium]|nr:hypothetical protein [Myxococcaceae bacterium]